MKVEKLSKYFQKRLERYKFPALVEFEDHHQPIKYYAQDLNELGKVFLHVLKMRLDSYFYEGELPEDEEVLTLEQIAVLPEQYKKDAMEKYNSHQEDIKDAEIDSSVYKKCKEAIKNKDGGLAWECLEEHRNRGDEDFEIISIESLRVKNV